MPCEIDRINVWLRIHGYHAARDKAVPTEKLEDLHRFMFREGRPIPRIPSDSAFLSGALK